MDTRFTRRNFLMGAAGAAGVLGVAGCSKKSGVIHVGGNNATQLNLVLVSGATDGSDEQALAVFEAGMDQRVAFVLAGKSGSLTPAPGSASLQIGSDEKHFGPSVPVTVHADSGAAVSTYLTTTYRFPKPGTYWLRAGYQGQTADSPVVVIDPGSAKIPFAGRKMITTATPTLSDSRGVNPICTRTPAMCPFHTQSLDTALTQGLPIALIFATPALCQTAFCGPVLDNLVAASAPYAGKINFVHSEIFVSLSRDVAETPAVLAYNLQSEPLLFLADAKATVVERIDGLFGKAEVTAALSRLANV